MPAKSKAQQALMGMAYEAKKTGKAASSKVASVAKGMSKQSLKDYASTSTKGLPKKVKKGK